MVKPFDLRELILRVERIISRTKEKTSSFKFSFGQYSFDCESKRLFNLNKNVPLTNSEVNLLYLLAKNAGQVVDRDWLAKELGGVNERTIDVQIIRLRSKIEDDPRSPVYIQTIRNKGYILHS